MTTTRTMPARPRFNRARRSDAAPVPPTLTVGYDWSSASMCREGDPEIFFAGGNYSEALAVCARCPVRRECLEEALADPDLKGIWGGTTARERGRIRKQRLQGASPR